MGQDVAIISTGEDVINRGKESENVLARCHMKKCPFCAEKVQDNAIKCKHCGEWFTQERVIEKIPKEIASEISEQYGSSLESQTLTSAESLPEENKGEGIADDDDEKYYRFPLKEKRWGWGWFVVLAIYANALRNTTIATPFPVDALGLAVVLVSYFWLRKRMIGMFSKLWKVSFVAGLLSLMISGAFVGAFSAILRRSG